ncbi:hypothetical protein K7X08_032504 [Anisodus acutangulus]|uniref:Uncharacterized protein n=1 Tax=Anisodus acutangulus TaxID=402998 RepID=A0A9Q1R4M3_9SOLA|nr:hypothetical protein K7X08_032504 [Anisodus acutangulus]
MKAFALMTGLNCGAKPSDAEIDKIIRFSSAENVLQRSIVGAMDQKFIQEFVELDSDVEDERIDRLKAELQGATSLKCVVARRLYHASPATPHNDTRMDEADKHTEGVGVQGGGYGKCGTAVGRSTGGERVGIFVMTLSCRRSW